MDHATIKHKNLEIEVIVSEYITHFGREYALVTPVTGKGEQLVTTRNVIIKETKNDTPKRSFYAKKVK